jgi:prepilin-type processing-associated H-X9-DG protein
MRPLSNEQKQLLFDYCLGLTSEKETAQTEVLISLKKEAAEIHTKLKVALAPLSCIQPEPCPDNLAEQTIRRLKKHADTSHLLLVPEQITTVVTKVHFFHNLSKILVRAAAILIIVGILIPPLSHGRSLYRRHICERRLGSISQNIDQYCNDFDGELPAVGINKDEPWCKVGYQGKENHSNTRNLFLLLKLGFSNDPKKFVCPGGKQSNVTPFDISEVQEYNDFPTRKHINYSLRVMCSPSTKKSMLGGQPFMADCNPVFESASDDQLKHLEIHLDKESSTRNCSNHNLRGQNVLYGDGHAEFERTRYVGIPGDDMFTLQNTQVYRGLERPSSMKDSFLAP